MSTNAAELAVVLIGGGSDERRRRILAEALVTTSEVSLWLAGLEAWSRSRLGNHIGDAVGADQSAPDLPRVVRRAAVTDTEQRRPSGATIHDLFEWCTGSASVEAQARIRTALNDPSTDLFGLLSSMEQWADKRRHPLDP